MSDFQEKKLLGDIIKLKYGIGLPKRNRKYGNFPVYGSGGIVDYHNEPFIKGPGIIIGRKGSIGTIYYEKSDFCPIDTVFYVHNKDASNNLKFIYYLLTQMNLHILNTDAAVPGLNRNVAHMQEIKLPDPNIQRKIAGILSAYDDLIKNNTRRIKILEEMAQRIYREWFVHFRYLGYKNLKLVESDLGMIPEMWDVKKLEDVCISIEDGDWIETKDQSGNEYRLTQISNIGVNKFIESDKYRYITQETFDRLNCSEIIPGDILVARMPKPIGRAWLVTEMPFRMITAVDVAIIKTNNKILDPLYCTHFLNSPFNLERVSTYASGTTRPRITRRDLKTLLILLPPVEFQKHFSDISSNIYTLCNKLRKQNDNLRQTRDLLLPKLISGKIDISELDVDMGAEA